MSLSVAVLPGDGIGPEVTAAAMAVLRAACSVEDIPLTLKEHEFGGAGIDAFGEPFPDETREACLASDAVFLGAVGGPKWDGEKVRPEAGLLALRQALGAFANLRPIQVMAPLIQFSPLQESRAADTDMLIVRELTGGLYFGERREGKENAHDSLDYSEEEVRRIAIKAFDAARLRRGHVTSVDKANVLATSRLWRHVVEEVAKDYPDVTLRHELVDAMAMHLISKPSAFDVILTENLFGDILSDEASVISGSIGLAGSASLGAGTQGLYEPIHGSAPDIAGQGKANPLGAILSVAMLLRYSAGAEAAAKRVERAVEVIVRKGVLTADLGGSANTWHVGDAVAEEVATGDAMFFVC